MEVNANVLSIVNYSKERKKRAMFLSERAPMLSMVLSQRGQQLCLALYLFSERDEL